MRHNEDATNSAQSLGELMGHDILLMGLSNPLERERLKAEVGTEHVLVTRWFRTVVERAKLLLGHGVSEPEAGERCRSAPRSAPVAHPPRVGQTRPASRNTDADLPPEDDFNRTARA